jgi:hypothetical protein
MKKERSIIKSKLPKSLIKNDTKETWLVQPTAITFMRYDYSLIQSKIFMRIIASMQSAIQEAIDNYLKKRETELSIFNQNEFKDLEDPNMISLKIPIKEFGIPATQYAQLKESLLALVTIPIETPIKDSTGRKWIELDNLCSVRIPDMGRVTYVYIRIKKSTAAMLLNMDLGFTKFLEETISFSTNVYTPRIYLILSPFLSTGECRIKTQDLRKYLRLTTKYKVFKDFVKRVITPVETELKRLSDEGKSNLYFTWKKKYSADERKSGEPMEIIFSLYPSKKVIAEERIEKKRHSVYEMLRGQYILMDEKYATEISHLVTMGNYTSIVSKLADLVSYLSKPDNNVTNPGKYTYSILKSLIQVQ